MSPHAHYAMIASANQQQHARGRLAMAYVRHRERFGLVGRPGCYSLHDPRGSTECHRVGELRLPVLENGRRQDVRQRSTVRRRRLPTDSSQLPTSLRWPVAKVRQGWTSIQVLRRGRSNRTRSSPHALRSIATTQYELLYRIFRTGPDHGGWRV
jgi:hypothetical protein